MCGFGGCCFGDRTKLYISQNNTGFTVQSSTLQLANFLTSIYWVLGSKVCSHISTQFVKLEIITGLCGIYTLNASSDWALSRQWWQLFLWKGARQFSWLLVCFWRWGSWRPNLRISHVLCKSSTMELYLQSSAPFLSN